MVKSTAISEEFAAFFLKVKPS